MNSNCLICGDLMDPLDTDKKGSKVLWCEPCEYGKSTYTFNKKVYDGDYADKYASYVGTELSNKLITFRTSFVRQYCPKTRSSKLLDFGCGTGEFCKRASEYYDVYGCEVNSVYQELWHSDTSGAKYSETIPDEHFAIVTFFDSFEHVQDIQGLLKLLDAPYLVFSIPIVPKNRLAVSKHLRPEEHLHYFTRHSLSELLGLMGYKMEAWSQEESKLGREDVETYVFRKTL